MRTSSSERLRLFVPQDLLVPAAVALLLVLLPGRRGGESGPPREAVVEVGGSADTLDLSVDTTVTYQGALGPVEVQVSEGRARVLSSPCPGQDCVGAGWLGSPGQVAVCVPSGLYLLVRGEGQGRVDAVSY